MPAKLYQPQALLDELGITEPDEIDLEAIAQYAGATVVYEPLTGAEARLLGAGDSAVITINENSPLPRQRFSIGHELGHWMHDRGRPQFTCTGRSQNASFIGSDPEALANRFATELLLPEAMFKTQLGKALPTLATVESLSEIFRTSLTATALRLVDIGAWPTMVTCYSKDRREWFKRGRDVPESLWPLRTLSEDSVAFHLLRDASDTPDTEEVDADAWIDHPDAGDYTVVESSFRVTPSLVVSLLWWKNTSQLRNVDDQECAWHRS